MQWAPVRLLVTSNVRSVHQQMTGKINIDKYEISFRKSNRCNIALCWTQRKSQPFKVIKFFDTPPRNPGVSKFEMTPSTQPRFGVARAQTSFCKMADSAQMLTPDGRQDCMVLSHEVAVHSDLTPQRDHNYHSDAFGGQTDGCAPEPLPYQGMIEPGLSAPAADARSHQQTAPCLGLSLRGACRPGIGSPGCHQHRRLWDCQDRSLRDPMRTRQGRFRPVTCQQVSVSQAGCPRSQEL